MRFDDRFGKLRPSLEGEANRGHEVGADMALGYVSHRADAARRLDERRVVVHREEDDAGRPLRLAQSRRRGEPAHHRHRDVEDDDVGLEGGDRVEHRLAVADCADDVELDADQRYDSLEHFCVIVGEQHADAGHERHNLPAFTFLYNSSL